MCFLCHHPLPPGPSKGPPTDHCPLPTPLGQREVHHRPHLGCRPLAQIPWSPGQHIQQSAHWRHQHREWQGQLCAQRCHAGVWPCPRHCPILQGRPEEWGPGAACSYQGKDRPGPGPPGSDTICSVPHHSVPQWPESLPPSGTQAAGATPARLSPRCLVGPDSPTLEARAQAGGYWAGKHGALSLVTLSPLVTETWHPVGGGR